MIEPKLNEVFKHDGLSLKCVLGSCHKCTYWENIEGCDKAPSCMSEDRSDCNDVIFEELKEGEDAKG